MIVIQNDFVPASHIAQERFSVWVKREWGDSWVRIPYLMPETSLENASPADSEARLRWDYGDFLNLWSHAGGNLLPLRLDNWFVMIRCHSDYGSFTSWIGIITGQVTRTEGTTANGDPIGIQDISALGLEWLLERRRVLGTFVGDGSSWAYMPRTHDFNTSPGRSQVAAGTMSAVSHPDAGCRMHIEGGSKWSNYRIIEYLLACFQPWYPLGSTAGGAVSLTPLFYMTGQTDALDYIYGEYRFHGKSVRECLNTLIDRRRGFGWHVQTDGVGPIYLRVYSLAPSPIVGREAYIPANPNQGWIPIGWDHVIGVEYNISSVRQVDQIVMESDEPVKVMATLGMDNGSLEPGWTSAAETDYGAANDSERASDQFGAVYSRFQVPKDYSWAEWVPLVGQFGEVDVTDNGAWWHFGKTFLRYLPIKETGVDDGEEDYIEPVIIVAKPDRTRDLALMLSRDGAAPYTLAGAQGATTPAITAEEFEAISTNDTTITASDITATIAANPAYFIMLDKANQVDEDYPAVAPTIGDAGLSFTLRGAANHAMAGNHWAGSSEVEAVFDYEQMLATFFWETDEMLRVTIPVFNSSYVDVAGNVVVEANPQGRQIHGVVPGAECWVAGLGTVTGVDEGALVYSSEGARAVLRDDSEDVWWAAVAAYVWYGSQRGSMMATIERQAPWFRIGDLIRGTINGHWSEGLGTTVTSIQRNYRDGWQIVRTGYGELDPETAFQRSAR